MEAKYSVFYIKYSDFRVYKRIICLDKLYPIYNSFILSDDFICIYAFLRIIIVCGIKAQQQKKRTPSDFLPIPSERVR